MMPIDAYRCLLTHNLQLCKLSYSKDLIASPPERKVIMEKFSNASEVVKHMLRWKPVHKLGLRFLYNIKVQTNDDGFLIRFDDVLSGDFENGLKFYLDYISDKQKKITI